MTLTEMIERLQDLSKKGYGDLPVGAHSMDFGTANVTEVEVSSMALAEDPDQEGPAIIIGIDFESID